MIYGVRSRISLYCTRRRMLRLRMRVVLLLLMAQRPTPVLVLAKIMLFSFGDRNHVVLLKYKIPEYTAIL